MIAGIYLAIISSFPKGYSKRVAYISIEKVPVVFKGATTLKRVPSIRYAKISRLFRNIIPDTLQKAE